MEKLISKYIQNTLTPAEAEQLRIWLEKDSHNRKVFENIVGGWKLSDDQIAKSKSKVMERVMESQTDRHQQDRTSHIKIFWKVAAILFLGVGLSFMISISDSLFSGKLSSTQEIHIEKEALNGQKLTFKLPDGSIVRLNSGSKLIYPKIFSEENRDVELVGEAFFDIQRDPKRPFKITTGHVRVQVLGTSFNVRSYPDDEEVSVAVKSGKVAVHNAKNDQVLLHKDEYLNYSSIDHSMDRGKIMDDRLAFGWMDHTLTFQDRSLYQIVKVLERWFDIDVTIDSKEYASSKAFTGTYNKPSLTSVMESLRYYYGFEYEIKGTEVIIM